jgi:hypothetical protein
MTGLPLVRAAACGLVLLLAVACHSPSAAPQPKADAPQSDDPADPVEPAQKQIDAARHLTPDQVAALEAAAAKDPADVESRAQLLIFYARGNYPAETRRIMLWMIQHHPEGITVWGSKTFSPGIDSVVDPDGYAQGKKLWLARLVHHNIPEAELRSAANYFKLADQVICQKLLLRAEVKDADPDLKDEYYENLAKPPKG